MMCIVGLDVGYGHVKAVSSTHGARGPEVVFPSIAPQAMDDSDDHAVTGMASLRVVPVRVNQKLFLVGGDAANASASSFEGRQRTLDYCTSDQYHALTLGALAMLRLPVIDILVLGLPMNTIGPYKDLLERKYCGRHTVPDTAGRDLTTVDVRKVLVLAQPVGALFSALSASPDLEQSRNLVIDVGYYTTDFFCCDGKRPIKGRSGAVRGGMAVFYDTLHLAAGKQYAKTFNATRPLDMAHNDYEKALLNRGGILSTFEGKLDLADAARASAKKVFDLYIGEIVSAIQRLDDIENVIFAGGGADLMMDRFKTLYPGKVGLHKPSRPQIAIAEGFLAAGAALAARAQV